MNNCMECGQEAITGYTESGRITRDDCQREFKEFNDLKCYCKKHNPIHNDYEYTDCSDCKNPLELCQCTCPYCGERDMCECALFDAATGG